MEKLKTTQKLIIMLSMMIAITGLYAQQAPTDGLVGYFSFDALSSGNIITDSGSASGNVGTLVGTGTALTSDSKLGANALQIDPTNGESYVEFSETESLPFAFGGLTQMSISLWVKPELLNSGGVEQTFLSVHTQFGGQTYYLEIDSNNFFNAFISRDGSGSYARATDDRLTAGDINTWIHVVLVHEGTAVKIYLDNVLSKEQPFPNADPITNSDFKMLYFGGIRKNGDGVTNEQFKGSIDELYFYNRALTSAEVEDLFDHGNGGVLNISPTDLAKVAIQPNPVQDVVNITNIGSPKSYNIISITGATLLSGETAGKINVASLAPGTYVLQVGVKAVKFVKL